MALRGGLRLRSGAGAVYGDSKGGGGGVGVSGMEEATHGFSL